MSEDKKRPEDKLDPAVAVEAQPSEEEVLQNDPDLNPADPRQHWYVIHTYSGHENKVRENIMKKFETSGLADKITKILIPTEEVTEIKEGKRRTATRKFFPGYILALMEITEETWHIVRNVQGVTGFVGSSTKPIPLDRDEVLAIKAQMGLVKSRPKPKTTFDPGDHIKVIEGPFADFAGTVNEVNLEKGKLKVMVIIFGRPTPVEFDFLQVEKV